MQPEISARRPTLGVGAVVVKDGALLMVRRAHDPGRGLWSVPGGRVEGGEHLTSAVKREVKEETGIEVEVGDLLGTYEVVGDGHLVVLDYLAEVAGDSAPVAGHDASEARWVPISDIPRLACTPRLLETLEGWGALEDALNRGTTR